MMVKPLSIRVPSSASKPRINKAPNGVELYCCGRKGVDAGRYGYGRTPEEAYVRWETNVHPWLAFLKCIFGWRKK